MLPETPRIPYPDSTNPDHINRISNVMRDWQIRTATERALLTGGDDADTNSKELYARGLKPIMDPLVLNLPLELPSVNGAGDNNNEINTFAYRAYDALRPLYGSDIWADGWFVALYLSEEDEPGQARLGLFSNIMTETVVE